MSSTNRWSVLPLLISIVYWPISVMVKESTLLSESIVNGTFLLLGLIVTLFKKLNDACSLTVTLPFNPNVAYALF